MNPRSRLIVLGLVALVVSLVSGCSGASQGQIKDAKLEVGDKVELMFRLDDEERSHVERTAVVRRVVEGNYVGCEFMDIGHLDTATGFYLMT